MQVGGEGHVVEIDETSLKKKSKYNRGTRHEDCWLFGGVDRTTNRWFGMIVFDDRTKPTLSDVIKRYIKPKTLIMSDMWRAYVSVNGTKTFTLENNRHLRHMQYSHKWVNHSKNFVDPKTGAHTQRIEGVWEVLVKQYLKAMRGWKRTLIASYLDWFL